MKSEIPCRTDHQTEQEYREGEREGLRGKEGGRSTCSDLGLIQISSRGEGGVL